MVNQGDLVRYQVPLQAPDLDILAVRGKPAAPDRSVVLVLLLVFDQASPHDLVGFVQVHQVYFL